MTDSPWYCPQCATWCGMKLEACANGHDRPRLPLLYRDVPFDCSWRVTWRHRLCAKARRLTDLARRRPH